MAFHTEGLERTLQSNYTRSLRGRAEAHLTQMRSEGCLWPIHQFKAPTAAGVSVWERPHETASNLS